MNVLIKSVHLVDASGKAAKEVTDILIESGVISKIGASQTAASGVQVFDGNGAWVSIGWVDSKANFRDPGHETKEGIKNGLEAAAAGGFTGVVLMSSTHPAIQSKADIEFLKGKSHAHPVKIYPTGALSVNRDGKDITEMFDMKNAGAVAFTDDRRTVSDSGLFMRALQYAKNIGSPIIHFPDDPTISGKGQVNEGIPSTMAGMKGMPSFAEELMVNRDLKICSYTDGRLHFSTISTAGAVALIRKAKAEGLHVTAEVAAHQLIFDDTTILEFNTNFKVKPPFRSKQDIVALMEGIADGTIDCICSDHSPEDEETKVVEFDFAAFGISGIETAFAVATTACQNRVGIERIIESVTVSPRKVFGLPVPEIKVGEKAELTIFNPGLKWVFEASTMVSKSKNTPFSGMELTGKPLAIYSNGIFQVCPTPVVQKN